MTRKHRKTDPVKAALHRIRALIAALAGRRAGAPGLILVPIPVRAERPRRNRWAGPGKGG